MVLALLLAMTLSSPLALPESGGRGSGGAFEQPRADARKRFHAKPRRREEREPHTKIQKYEAESARRRRATMPFADARGLASRSLRIFVSLYAEFFLLSRLRGFA